MATNNTDRAFKTLVNRRTTDENKAYYEEISDQTINIYVNDIWTGDISATPATAVLAGVAQQYTLFSLTEDVSVASQQAWYADDGYGSRLKNWISDKYGDDYSIHLFDNADNEIFPTDSLDWFWDYQTGILTISGNASAFSQPFKISGYRYIGPKGFGGSDDIGAFKIVDTIDERNAIPINSRSEGDHVYVKQTECQFILKGGVDNSNWYFDDSFQGRSSYQGLVDFSSITNIYVSATGSDVDGYGTQDAPYRQVQRAMKDIPVGASGDFRIYCGPGTFKPFHFVPVTGRIYVIGSTENPVATTFPFSSGTLVSGKYARRQLNMTGGWVDTITDGSHWVLDINNIGNFQCSPVEQSTTPTLNIVGNISSGTSGKGLYPYETTITDPDEYYNGLSIFAPDPTINDVGRYYLIGLELTDIVNMSNVSTMACKFNCSNHYFVNYSGSGYLGGVIDGNSVSEFNIISGSNVYTDQGLLLINGATLSVKGGRLRLNTAIVKDGSNVVVDECGSMTVGLTDFETNVSNVIDAKGRSQVIHLGNCSVSSSPTTLLRLSDASYRVQSGVFVGDTSGISVVLENGGQAISISSSLTLTSSGAGQISVGANPSPFNFSDLPKTDVAMGDSSELCRGT